ncbi:hypothetical protein [Kushneria aurantia]|uniref:Uncharacterized protein n=1 Tax=Kushneria aurantia TaxID=504092 RepID=A0ABV6G4I1_9GAMM|nr:hypothetical protein [Kushneria aurantia]
MHSRFIEDRRCKADGEHLDNPVKTRLTDEEFDRLERHAEKRHGGVLSHTLREYLLMSMDMVERREQALIEALDSGQNRDELQREITQALMAQIVDQRMTERLAARVAQQQTA